MYKIDKKIISVLFHLGFSPSHHKEYCSRVEEYLILLLNKSSYQAQIEAHQCIIDGLDEEIEYDERGNAILPRSKDSLIKEFDERMNDFHSKLINGYLLNNGFIWKGE